jgi:GH15 family glucan-1,4-alpha-glucosidase
MYGVDGTRRIPEWEVDWLPGYEASAPVRVGNAASQQLQLDVYGELLDAIYQCHRAGLPPEAYAWGLQRVLLQYLESTWSEPDNGIWEVRGPRRHFTHSKVMSWVAFDRGIKSIERLRLPGPLERWVAVRDEIHRDVCRAGYDESLGAFVQYSGSRRLDASLLMMPLVGFLPATDARVCGTMRAIEERLMDHGLVRRYQISSDGAAADAVDGLPGTDGVFLPCTFWLANNWALVGRHEAACRLFERLLCLANDVGLLSEEYDARTGAALGNCPQAFSHVALVNTANNLSLARKEPGRHCRET